jgi:hypothetical protein
VKEEWRFNRLRSGLVASVQGLDLKIDPASSTCMSTLPSRTSCVISAIFMAVSAGSSVGDNIVVSQGGVVKSVPITADALTPAKLAVTPATASLAAAPGTASTSVDIAVGNIGGMSAGPLVVALSGKDAADFIIVSDKCSIVILASGNYCVLTVAYKPPSTATATQTATVTVVDKGSAASSATVALAGTPIEMPSLSITGGPSLGSAMPDAISSNTCATRTTPR